MFASNDKIGAVTPVTCFFILFRYSNGNSLVFQVIYGIQSELRLHTLKSRPCPFLHKYTRQSLPLDFLTYAVPLEIDAYRGVRNMWNDSDVPSCTLDAPDVAWIELVG